MLSGLTFTLSSYYSEVYPIIIFFIFISTKKGASVKKGLLVLVAALFAVLFLYIAPTHAQFKKDFLYKFQSRWADVAVNNAGTRIFLINESYSRIEEYNSSGVLQAIHGSFGTGATQFNRPGGMVMDSTSDNLYVVDTGNNRIMKCNTSGALGSDIACSYLFGSIGTAVRQFSNPHSITTNDVNLFIADTGNNRIQRCTMDGVTCTAWGQLGTANGRYSAPQGVTYHAGDGYVYVADTANNRIQVITDDATGTYVSSFGSYGITTGLYANPYRVISYTTYLLILDTSGRIQKVDDSTYTQFTVFTLPTAGTGMAFNGTTLYVSELNTTLEKYNLNTSLLTSTISNKEIGRPVDMVLDSSNNIYVNNNFNENTVAPTPVPVLQKFDSNFVQLNEWTGGVSGFTSSSTTGPMGIGVNTGNETYVADTDANKLQKLTSAGDWVDVPTPGAPVGAYSSPKDVATEATGKYYVADSGNARIVKYDPGYGFTTWAFATPTPGGPTIAPGLTPEPYGITVASDNTIYVADYGFSRIQSFNANGTFIRSWGEFGSDYTSSNPQLDRPQGMAIDSGGYIYVADTYNSRIQRFSQAGAENITWGNYGAGDGQFNIPRNVAVDPTNRVYVSEVGNKRIQVFGDAAASAGLTISQTNGTTISEGISSTTMGIDSYTVKLNTQPSAPVTIAVGVSEATEAAVLTPTLVFTQYNWNIPQTVTVVPIHDFVGNGTHSVIISHKPSSTDTYYQNSGNTSWSDVTVTISDTIDIPGVTFSSNIVPWATEGATLSNAYSIVLDTKPTRNVTITLFPDSSMTVDQTTFTFTPTGDDYSTARWVNITPVHDFVVQGEHIGLINHTATSTDVTYSSPAVPFSEASGNVAVTIQDIDTAGVIISKASVSVNETGTGTTDTYTVRLNSKPTSEVQIYPTDASTSAHVTLSPSTLSFLSTTWSTPQTVTVTAIHDYLTNPSDFIPPITKIVHNSTYSIDSMYDNINIASVAATVVNTDTSNLLIFKPGGGSVQVTETGTTDNYVFQLTSLPTGDVTVTLSTDTQITMSKYSYTFTPSNWDVPQYATVSAVDNFVEDGTHNSLITHTLSSTDGNFDTKTAIQTAIITDNDAAGIAITLPNGTINIVEAGPTDTYSVNLTSSPSAQVDLIFGAQNQATASPANLIFPPSEWATPQTIVITAIQDYIVQGTRTATVSYTGISADTKYNGKTASFLANITDDDSLSPGISVIETDGGTSVQKDITTDTYTLSLTSKPSANVRIKVMSSSSEATTSAGIFWFTPSVWNVPQTVNVLAKSNPVGGKTVTFSHIVTSLDLHYDAISAPTVTVTVNENTLTSPSAANAKAPVCGMTPPYSAPNLFQITTNKTQATLYFTPLRENISYYFVAYGFTPGDLRFGTSFGMGPYDGVLDYTVNMLTPGTKYYFMIRGGNGCATGPWSSSLAATAVGPTSSAATTYSYYAPISAPSTPGSSGSSSPTGGISLTRDLYPGSQGADVRSLQQYLNSKGFTLASSGAGSPGNETTYYGNLTASAVRRFQEAHFTEILNPLGYASGTGICGPSTRNYINSHP